MTNQMHAESALGKVSPAPGQAPTTPSPESALARFRGGDQARELLTRLFRRYPDSINLRRWNATSFRGGANAAGADSPFTLVFRSPEAVWSAVLGRDPLALADAYFRGDLDIEGDFFAALSIKDHLDVLQMPVGEKLLAAFKALHLRMMNAAARHTEALFAPSH